MRAHPIGEHRPRPLARAAHSAGFSIGRGIVAGFVATIAVSALHEPILLLTSLAGMAAPPGGWLFHFFVGTVLWGSLFGLVHDLLYGPSWLRGIVFGAGGGLVVLLLVMPALNGGWLGLRLGALAPFAIVAFHLTYGALLGTVYGAFGVQDDEPPH